MMRIRITLVILLVLAALGLRATPTLAASLCPVSEQDIINAMSSAGSAGTVSLSCPGATTIYFDTANGHTGNGSPITISSTVTLDASGSPASITFDGGHTSAGGGVQLFSVNAGGTLDLRSLTLEHGNSDIGGAIHNAGTLTITKSTFAGNSGNGVVAGGGAIDNAGTLTITDSTFSANSGAPYGGAIFTESGGTMIVTSSTFSANSSSGNGGAIFNAGTMTTTTSTFSGNSASNGGAIANNGGSLTITSSTISGNSASYRGGAIDNNSGTTRIGGSIIANSSRGGNCYNNIGTIADGGYNLEDTSTSSCGFSSSTNDIVGQDPQLGPLASNGGPTQTMALATTSPVIDQIPTSAASLCPSAGTDQRGSNFPRPDNGETSCDIGAYEHLDAVRLCPSSEQDIIDEIASVSSGGTVTLSCPSATTIYFDAGSGHTGTGTPITITQSVTLDASTSPGAITFDGGHASSIGTQLFIVNSGATLDLRSLTLQNANTPGSDGGAIVNNGGTVSIANSTLSANSAYDGGAIDNNGGTVSVANSTVFGNSAANFAGAITNTGTMTITNSTFTANYAPGQGGAIYNRQDNSPGTVSITNSTFSANSATSGGAILNDGTAAVGGSIITNNTGGNCAGSIADQGYNLENTSPSTCGFSSSSHDIVGQGAQLGPLQNNGGPTRTMAPATTSPAIDQIPTSDASLCPTAGTDQRGQPRPDDSESSCDIGAYESAYLEVGITSAPPSLTGSTSASFAFSGSGGGGPLTYTCRLDSGTAVSCTSPQNYSNLANGSHTFVVTVTDGVTFASARATWTVDSAPPGVTITPSSEPANPTNSTSASFAWTGSDSYDTITGYTCQMDGGTPTGCTSPQKYSTLSDGSHTFTVTATDAAGNSGSTSYQWTIDTVPPVISINGPAANATYPLDGSGSSFTFSCTDAYATASSCTGSLSGTGISGTTAVTSGDAIPTSVAGSFTLTVNATDQAGNTGQQQVSYTVTNPIPSSSSLNQTSAAAGAASFTLKVYGSNFVSNVSQVDWNGTALTGATYYSTGTAVTSTGGLADEIDVTVPSSNLATASTASITVVNPAPGGGTSNLQAFYVTPATVSVSASNSATSTSSSGTATATVGGTGAGTSGSLTAAGSGQGTVAVAQYSANPETSAPPTPVNTYFDVYVPSGSSFSGVTITDCNLAGGSVLYDWTGSAWAQVPNQRYSAGPPACVTATITNASVLSGTPFAVSDQPPILTLPSSLTVQQSVMASLQISATDPEGDTLTLSASGLPSGLSLGSTTCAGGVCSATISGAATATVGSYTATITAAERDDSAATATQNLTVYVDTNLSSYPKLSSGAYNLQNATLSSAYLVNFNLAGASAQNATLTGANLTKANLANANLSQATLSGANLSKANLTNANLSQANLKGATGMGTATLTGVIWSKTTCPDNTLSTNDGGTCLGHL